MAWLDLAAQARDATEAMLGEAASYTPPAGSPVSIVGLFDAAFVRQELSNGILIETVGPALAVSLSGLPGGAAVRGAAVVVRGAAFTVAEVHLDGHGGALLRLHAA